MCCATESCDVFDVTRPVARKRWHCDECGSKIEPGERYTRIAVLYDGQWSTGRNCSTCWAAKLRANAFGFPLFAEAEPWLDECITGGWPCAETNEAYAEYGAGAGLLFALNERRAAL